MDGDTKQTASAHHWQSSLFPRFLLLVSPPPHSNLCILYLQKPLLPSVVFGARSRREYVDSPEIALTIDEHSQTDVGGLAVRETLLFRSEGARMKGE